MIAFVTSALKYPEEDEASGYRSVKDAQEDQGRDHEGKRHFFEYFISQRPESRGDVVLGPCICVNDCCNHAEDDYFADRNSPERLRKILGVLHFSNEARDGDLSNESVADVQKRVHPTHEACVCNRYNQHEGLASEQSSLSATRRIVSLSPMFPLDTGKDSGQEDRDEGEKC